MRRFQHGGFGAKVSAGRFRRGSFGGCGGSGGGHSCLFSILEAAGTLQLELLLNCAATPGCSTEEVSAAAAAKIANYNGIDPKRLFRFSNSDEVRTDECNPG